MSDTQEQNHSRIVFVHFFVHRFHKYFNLILGYRIFPLILLGRLSELWSPTSAVERPSAPGGYFEGNLYYEMGMWVERCM